MKKTIGRIYLYYLKYFPIKKGKHLLGKILTIFFNTFILRTTSNISLEVFLSSTQDISYLQNDLDDNTILISEINNLREGAVFIDVGANIGYYSILASKKVGQKGFVLAFEPSIREYKRLVNNIVKNKCTNILTYNIALSDTQETMKINISKYHTGMNSLTQMARSEYNQSQIVPTFLFDNVLPKNISYIDLVKIDVEGAEYFVLKGMLNMLAFQKISKLIIEITPVFFKEFGYNKNDIYTLLNKYGYKSTVNSESWQYDELFIL